MRSRWKNQFHTIEGASRFHRSIQKILMENEPFNTMKCYQEVPVQDLIPEYEYPLHRIDWYVESLRTIIELHGQQHYQVVNFGSIGWNQAHDQFLFGRARDSVKKHALIQAGYRYIELSYQDKKVIDATLVRDLLFEVPSVQE